MNAPRVTQHGRGDPKSPALAPSTCPLCNAAECDCDAAGFFEILAEQEVYSDE